MLLILYFESMEGIGGVLEGQVLGLEALSPQKLFCPGLEDSTIF